RRPDGNGGWTWSLGETTRVLYRLPQIATAIGRGEAVYIVEGEKDANTLGERGLTATTNPGGANKWRPEYAEALRGADVVIIGDNDQAGRDHVAQVASSLHSVARRVRVFNLAAAWPECPAKGDITGWIEAGHTIAELETLVAALPEWKPAEQDARQGETALRDVDPFLAMFVAYPSAHARTAHALWVLHTHLMDRWDSTPRLAFLSAEPASGKSRSLEVTELLVPRPVVAVNVSPAYLFRKVGSEEGPPTILFDEIDTVFGPKAKDNEEVRAVLKAGHRGGAVGGGCVVQGKTVMTEELPAYSAVALAGLGWLPDTIMSRAVIIRMQRRRRDEKVEAFRRRIHEPEGGRIRQRIAIWARQVPAETTWPDMPEEIQDRDADVWEPLIAVADLVGDEWPGRARAAAIALVAAGKEVEPSLGIQLLADARAVFADYQVLASKTMVANLVEIEEAPWGNLKGRPLDERGLARRLRQFGIKSKNVRTHAGVPKGYMRADFEDAWRRYLPPSPGRSATSATSATIVNIQRADVANNKADVAACSGQSREKCWQYQCRSGCSGCSGLGGHGAGDQAGRRLSGHPRLSLATA